MPKSPPSRPTHIRSYSNPKNTIDHLPTFDLEELQASEGAGLKDRTKNDHIDDLPDKEDLESNYSGDDSQSDDENVPVTIAVAPLSLENSDDEEDDDDDNNDIVRIDDNNGNENNTAIGNEIGNRNENESEYENETENDNDNDDGNENQNHKTKNSGIRITDENDNEKLADQPKVTVQSSTSSVSISAVSVEWRGLP